ncbi:MULTISPECIES: YidC/Oxa1 family membrane protein insertase [unclassified Paenibacillus]|uniref:YidC/Oxa1 family membrane protein insertase n=1 Tax=unclassified Paenibacillus TaxID=185978 RepID=UPI00104A3ED2|nr:YidC/Oxa1 family membrane protein insertase [Paenibacillus sp. BK033]TCM96803.1 YidC/Oxa1 family membrane protein insertase [Paenibacillus sp. BK033]
MLVLKGNRKWLLVLGMVLMVALLSGCAPHNATTSTADLQHGNFWEKNVVYYFALTLDKFADWFNGSYGLAILLITIIVRTAILPLTLKQYRSSKAMQAIQPQMAEIKKKYKDNPQKQQEETMKLFQANKVNPMAGCLPLLVQMPVFMALYNSIYWNPEVRTHEFLGLQLGEPGPWYFLPIIAAATTFVQSKMMQKQQTQTMPGMGAMLMIFPVLIFVMALNFPSALPLYWIFSNIYTIIQNYFLYVRSSNKGKEALAK